MTYAWKKMNVIPLSDLEAWHHYEPGVSGHHIIYDASGKDRHISCAVGNSAILTADVLNSQPGWYFNGSRTPLVFNGGLLAKHIFIVAAYEDAAFPDNQINGFKGLLTGINTGDILVGNAGADTFYDYSYPSYNYRKSDVAFPANSQKAPMSMQIAVIEIIKEDGFFLDGIQIGQQRNFVDRRWKGYFIEDLIYSAVRNDHQRSMIYQYFAMRYHLWQKNSAGLNVFPFPANKTRAASRDREHYLSEPYSGSQKALVLGSIKRAFKLPFAFRLQAEFEAAEAFHEQHHPVTDFIYRDYRFIPAKDRKCRITSPIEEQGSDVTFRFNYSFDAIETD
jgi:hypothetical protein